MLPTRPVKTDDGPTSTKVRAPLSYIDSTISTKRTEFESCRASCARIAASSLPSYGSAVSFAWTGMVGAEKATSVRKSPNAELAPLTTDEWKAVATGSRLAATP